MVPGDFIPDGQPRPASQELQQQRQRVGDLRPVPTTAHGKEQIRTKVPQWCEMTNSSPVGGKLGKKLQQLLYIQNLRPQVLQLNHY